MSFVGLVLRIGMRLTRGVGSIEGMRITRDVFLGRVMCSLLLFRGMICRLLWVGEDDEWDKELANMFSSTASITGLSIMLCIMDRKERTSF
jgi:hypothetical protein